MSILSVVCFSGNVCFDMKRIVQTIIMIVFMTEKLVTSVVYSYSTIGIVALSAKRMPAPTPALAIGSLSEMVSSVYLWL